MRSVVEQLSDWDKEYLAERIGRHLWNDVPENTPFVYKIGVQDGGIIIFFDPGATVSNEAVEAVEHSVRTCVAEIYDVDPDSVNVSIATLIHNEHADITTVSVSPSVGELVRPRAERELTRWQEQVNRVRYQPDAETQEKMWIMREAVIDAFPGIKLTEIRLKSPTPGVELRCLADAFPGGASQWKAIQAFVTEYVSTHFQQHITPDTVTPYAEKFHTRYTTNHAGPTLVA